MSQTEQTAQERAAVHDTFTIKRTYDAPQQRVFDAWADLAAKTQWFGPADKPAGTHTLDFREGGREHLAIAMQEGPSYTFDALYQDIVAGERIVYTYEMHRDTQRISVSVATVEFEASGTGTRLTLTEQGVYLDGLDTPAAREHGTNVLMDALGALVEGAGGGA